MKKLTIIVFIILVIVISVGIAVYARMTTKGGPALTGSSPTAANQATGAGFPVTTAKPVPSPIPTVAQIMLTITSPVNGSSVTAPTLVIKGITSPKADVFVNDSEVIADAQGNFTTQVTLDEGDNTLVVTANDANGNYSEKDLTVTYNSAQ